MKDKWSFERSLITMPVVPLSILQNSCFDLTKTFHNSTIDRIFYDSSQKDLVIFCVNKGKHKILRFILDARFPCLFEERTCKETGFCPQELKPIVQAVIKDIYVQESSHTVVVRFCNISYCLVFELFKNPRYYFSEIEKPKWKSPLKEEPFDFENIKIWHEFQKFSFLKKKATENLQKQMMKLEKQKNNLIQQLKDTNQIEDIRLRGELLKVNFCLLKKGLSQIEVFNYYDNNDIVIDLDPQLSPKEQIDSYFRKAKKMKLAKEPLKKAILKLDDKIHTLTLLQEKLATCQDLRAFDLLPFGQVEKTKRLENERVPYHTFISSSNKHILVGKSQKDNDVLSFQIARGNDYWLHAKNIGGSHVIIRCKKNESIDQKTLSEAMQLALYFSKARSDPTAKYEVIVTLKKYVRRAGNIVGKAQISQEKAYQQTLDPNTISELKKRSIKD